MNRTRVMILLSLLLCGALLYAWVATPKQKKKVAGQRVTQSARQNSSVLNLAASGVADLDFSQGLKTRFTPPEKSLFAPLYLPSEPVKPRPTPPPKNDQPKPVVPELKAKPIAAAVEGAEPIQPLQVLGFLNKGGERTVFLASTRGEIYIVSAGDEFSDGLSVAKMTPQEITIVRRATAQQVVLPIGEIKSQRLPSADFSSGRPEYEAPAEPSEDTKVINKQPAENPFINAIKKLGN